MDNTSMNSKSSENSHNDEKRDFNIDNTNEKMQAAADLRVVLPGDYIGQGLIAGHGTYENSKDGKIYANMAGVVHQID